MTERVKYVVTMIHGTFARNALWTSDGSSLYKALREQLPGELVIQRFPWSGANRNSDRIEAGKKLSDALNKTLVSYPDASHFIIAHSHGGNLALYALNDTRLQEGLSGIICMNTPFISATRRDAEQLFFGLGVLFIIEYVVWVALGLTMIAPAWEAAGNVETIVFTSIMLLFFALAGYMFFWLFRFGRWLRSWFKRKREEMIASLTLPNIRGPKVLCLWTAGDEVFTIFNVLEGFANIPYVLMNVYSVTLIFAGFLALPILSSFMDIGLRDFLQHNISVFVLACCVNAPAFDRGECRGYRYEFLVTNCSDGSSMEKFYWPFFCPSVVHPSSIDCATS